MSLEETCQDPAEASGCIARRRRNALGSNLTGVDVLQTAPLDGTIGRKAAPRGGFFARFGRSSHLRAMRRSCTTAVSRRLRATHQRAMGGRICCGGGTAAFSRFVSAQPRGLRSPRRAPQPIIGLLLSALFVADFQVLELREVGKLLVGNAHRRASLLQGGDELVGLLLARIGDVELMYVSTGRAWGYLCFHSAMVAAASSAAPASTCAAARKTRDSNSWVPCHASKRFNASTNSRCRFVKK